MNEPGTILIAYFSRQGFNYVRGSIVNLPKGNTEVVAEKLRSLTGGELFQICTHDYPADYTACTEQAKQELKDKARPPVLDKLANMDSFRTVLLGYPNWWGTMPMAVHTFLEQYDFTGKRVAPFCTHEGSGMGRSEKDLTKLCPGAEILPGLTIPGHAVAGADTEIRAWLKKLGFTLPA
ncbi:MAG: NAD(P)H-dependent oxidoreductase [Deltaproteobacteria bacterium]|nr:NAD(P)H-dependent oxidoreductase [Deltaproteobacteria bacterium]